jgi:outer membrane protein assembly factor BamB
MVALLAVGALVLSSCDWAQFGSGPQHTQYNLFESGISASNVSTLTQRFIALTPHTFLGWGAQPAVANGVLYAATTTGAVFAFDAAGQTNCLGGWCQPLWTAAAGTEDLSSPAVGNGDVYITSYSGTLYVFDANGSNNCSGTPKTCSPLWTAATSGQLSSSPTLANNVVYVYSSDGTLSAFDANGNNNCSGTPKRCSPLWTATTGGSDSNPTVANGLLYVDSFDGSLYAFDANGNNNCSGTPKTCLPLWSAPTHRSQNGDFDSTPTAANGLVYVMGSDPNPSLDTYGTLYAFDANGNNNCSGTPKTCLPLWTAPPLQFASTSRGNISPAVANGVVYIAGTHGVGGLLAFDANGNVNCSGTPKTCSPLWTAPAGGGETQPVVANGIVYDPGLGQISLGAINAFDANGNMNCSGTPKTCSPLATVSNDGATAAVVANGRLYFGGSSNIYAYSP